MNLILWGIIIFVIGISIVLSWAERKEMQKKQNSLEEKIRNLTWKIGQRKEFKDVEI